MTAIDEREQLARIDLALADIATRQEQLRQMRVFPAGTYEGWKLAIGAMTAGAALLTAGGALTALLLHLTGKLT